MTLVWAMSAPGITTFAHNGDIPGTMDLLGTLRTPLPFTIQRPGAWPPSQALLCVTPVLAAGYDHAAPRSGFIWWWCMACLSCILHDVVQGCQHLWLS